MLMKAESQIPGGYQRLQGDIQLELAKSILYSTLWTEGPRVEISLTEAPR